MSFGVTDREAERLCEEGIIAKREEDENITHWDWVPGSPKYIKCEQCGSWLKTHDGDFSLVFCPTCKVNWVTMYGDDEDRAIKTINLVMKGMATNTPVKL